MLSMCAGKVMQGFPGATLDERRLGSLGWLPIAQALMRVRLAPDDVEALGIVGKTALTRLTKAGSCRADGSWKKAHQRSLTVLQRHERFDNSVLLR